MMDNALSPKTPSQSPDRYTFQCKRYLTTINDPESSTEQVSAATDILNMFQLHRHASRDREQKPDWHTHNLEADLRCDPVMLRRVRMCDAYAQNLYAALCNNSFTRREVMSILQDKQWHCSWRYAGGIIADMRGHGDYIDWYCSGIRRSHDMEDMPVDDVNPTEHCLVPEGVITDQIRSDKSTLGWFPAAGGDWEKLGSHSDHG